jgi:hypothetical protein
MGLHYHSDGHGGSGKNDLNLYNSFDYVGRKHPPIVGFALDGIALYGKYSSSYTNMHGYSTELDEYGGHDHGEYGYHYHCHDAAATSTTDADIASGHASFIQYTMHILLKGAWRGNINSIPEFWDTSAKAPAYSLSQKHKYVGKAV